MKLLLTSNGLTDSIGTQLLALLTKPPEKNKVGFITTAAFGEEENSQWNRETWLQGHRSELINLGLKNIGDIDLRKMSELDLRSKVLEKDIVYVDGGNTFYLLYWARESKFNTIIQEFIKQDGIYVGVSAGSILACPTIETAAWEPADKNNVRIIDLSALSLVPFLIHPHLEESQKEYIAHETEKTKLPVVALTDSQAVLVTDRSAQIVGEGNNYMLNGFNKYL